MQTRIVESKQFLALCAEELAAGRALSLQVWGSSMEPWISSGDRVRVRPFLRGQERLRRGQVVLGQAGPRLKLHRIRTRRRSDGWLYLLQGDAQPEGEWIAEDQILGLLQEVRRRSPLWRRLWDHERVIGSAEESLASVRHKFHLPEEVERQVNDIPLGLTSDEEDAFRLLGAPGRVLIIGCGTGREAFALEASGWRVEGVDVSAPVIAAARAAAQARSSTVKFRVADIAQDIALAGPYEAILFSRPVYGHLPTRALRVQTLRRTLATLAPGGAVILVVYISGRELFRVRLARWLRSWGRRLTGRPSDAEPGDILVQDVSGAPGTPGTCFLHLFRSDRDLREEITAAGGRAAGRHGNCWIVRNG